MSDEPWPTIRTSAQVALPQDRGRDARDLARRARAGGAARRAARGSPRGSGCPGSVAVLSRRHGPPRRRACARPRGRRRGRRRPPGRRAASSPDAGAAPGCGPGTVLAASSACSSGTPSATRLRTASIIVSALPASTPSSRRTTSSATTISISPSAYVPSPSPAPAIASVTSDDAPGGDAPEQPDDVRVEVDAVDDRLDDDVGPRRAPPRRSRGPGGCSGRIALKTCVTVRTPRSNAACASAAVASVWPSETRDPACVQQVDQLERPGQLRRERDERGPGPAASSRSSSAGSGSRRAAGGACRGGRGARNGPLEVDAEDARRPARRPARPRAPRRARPPPR